MSGGQRAEGRRARALLSQRKERLEATVGMDDGYANKVDQGGGKKPSECRPKVQSVNCVWICRAGGCL